MPDLYCLNHSDSVDGLVSAAWRCRVIVCEFVDFSSEVLGSGLVRMLFKRFVLSFAACAAVIVAAGYANAESFLFDFTVKEGNSVIVTGNGTLEASQVGVTDAYQATSGTLVLTSSLPIPSLVGVTYDLIPTTSLGTVGVFTADDLIYPVNSGTVAGPEAYSPSFLDGAGGLAFGSTSGTEFLLSAVDLGKGQYGFFGSYGAGQGFFYNPAGGGSPWSTTTFDLQAVSASPSVQSVPEPSSFALLGLGGIGLAISAYRRRRMTAV